MLEDLLKDAGYNSAIIALARCADIAREQGTVHYEAPAVLTILKAIEATQDYTNSLFALAIALQYPGHRVYRTRSQISNDIPYTYAPIDETCLQFLLDNTSDDCIMESNGLYADRSTVKDFRDGIKQILPYLSARK